MHKIYYIGWVGYKNVGDELMLDCFKELCSKYLDSNEYELIPSLPSVELSNIDEYDSIVLGGGSILLDGYIDILYNAMKKEKNIFIWGSGYDWANKEFIDILEHSDCPPYLYSDSTEYNLSELVNYIKFFGVRGPLTYKLLQKSFIDVSNVLVSGDPGFLVSPKKLDDDFPCMNFFNRENVVAVNWGTCLNNIYGRNENSIEIELCNICNSLIQKGYRIYLYTVWKDDIPACKRFYKKIDNKSMILLDTNLYSGGELVTILQKCKFSINLKLHANIMSSVARTPFICLGYRFKSMDFVKSISCEDLIVFTDDKHLKSSVENKIEYICDNYDFIKNKIDEEINKYNSLLETPFINNLFK